MKSDDFIFIDDICTHYQVKQTFIHALHESDIIHLKAVKRKYYLPVKEINEFEKMRRLHYEMDINLEGLAVVQNLLTKIEKLQFDKHHLKNRLRLYE